MIGYAATAILALGLGSVSASSASAPASAPKALPGPTVTVPGPAITVTVPGPKRIVTKVVRVPGPVRTVTKVVKVPGPVRIVTKTVTAVAAVAMAGDGTYEVGVDVRPGTYVSSAPERNCYWARLMAGDGLDSIIDNHDSSGQSVVTIKSRDKYFESNGCADWRRR